MQLSVDRPRSRITPGDLVQRTYHLSVAHHHLGIVISRDGCGFLDVLWGQKVEHMWDDFDLDLVDDDGTR